MNRILLAVILMSAVGGNVRAENWPTWRGPEMRGWTEGNPPVTFAEGKNVKWKVAPPGAGESTPVIWGDRLFLLTALKLDSVPGAESRYDFQVLGYDRRNGQLLWQTSVGKAVPHEGHHPDHGFASASPVTDGVHVWCFFGSRGLHCLDLDGKLKWSQNLGKMTTRAHFGEGSSPALTRQAVIALLDQEGGSRIVALDRLTGKTLWSQPRQEMTSWTTPLVLTHDGVEQVIVSGTNRTRSYAADTGRVLWECGGQTTNVIPAPVTGFGLVYCTSGFKGNALQAIRLGGQGDLTGTAAVVWEWNKFTPYVPSPLLYGDLIYFFAGTKARLSCLNARTGAAHFTDTPIAGMKGVYASPVGAAGRIYLAGRDGAVAVIKQSPTLEVLAVNTLADKFDASPAIVGDALYLRGKKHLYCIAE